MTEEELEAIAQGFSEEEVAELIDEKSRRQPLVIAAIQKFVELLTESEKQLTLVKDYLQILENEQEIERLFVELRYFKTKSVRVLRPILTKEF